MTRAYLVRHGRAAAGWDSDPDPGLDDLGRSQSLAVARQLAPLGPLAVASSPLLRCQQTAFPLAAAWGATVRVEPDVAEIPSPEGVAMADRVEWLRASMAGTWADLGPRYTAFRDGVVAAITSLAADTVVFSHFIAINAVVGRAIDDDRVMHVPLANCSVTTIDAQAGHLQVVEVGAQAVTEVW